MRWIRESIPLTYEYGSGSPSYLVAFTFKIPKNFKFLPQKVISKTTLFWKLLTKAGSGFGSGSVPNVADPEFCGIL